MSVTGRRCDEHHRRRGLGPEGPAGRGAGVRLTSCVRPDSPASPARCHPLGAKASEPIREPGASRSGHHTDVLSEGLSETALCPPGAHRLPSRCAPRLEFPTYTNSPVLLRRAPNRHLCWLRQYFPFIAVMRVNIFPEITSEKCAWILNTCDPDIRGERLFQTHTHTRVRASTPAAPRRRVVNSALRAAPQSFPGGPGLRAEGPRSWGRGRVHGGVAAWAGGRVPRRVSHVGRWTATLPRSGNALPMSRGWGGRGFRCRIRGLLPTKGSGGGEGSG